MSHRQFRCLVHKTRITVATFKISLHPLFLSSVRDPLIHPPPKPGTSQPPLPFPSLLPPTSHSNPHLIDSASEVPLESSLCSHHHRVSLEPPGRLLRRENMSQRRRKPGFRSLGHGQPAACVTLGRTVYLCEAFSFIDKEQ